MALFTTTTLIQNARVDQASIMAIGMSAHRVLTSRDRLNLATFDQRTQRDLGQKSVDSLREVHPEVVRDAYQSILAVTGATTTCRIDSFADAADDLRHVDGRGLARECIPAAGSAQTLDEPSAFQLAEQLFQIGLRDALARRNVGERNRTGSAVKREVQHRRDRIAAFRREPHGQ